MAICSEGSNALETVGMTTLTDTTSSTRIAVKKISFCSTVVLGLFVTGRYYRTYQSLQRKGVRRFFVYFIGCSSYIKTFQFCVLREEHRLRVFENRVLRRIFGPKRDGVTQEWRKLHNEERNDCTLHPVLCG